MNVIVTGLFLLCVITFLWYISNTVASSFLYAMFDALTATESGTSLTNLVTFLNIMWGPVLDILIIVWMISAAQQRDVESVLYG